MYDLAHGDMRSSEQEVDEAIRRAPRDARFRLAMVWLRVQVRDLTSSATLVEAVERLSEVADTPAQLRVVASAQRQLRRPDKALEFARRAHALAPIDPLVLDTYAAALFDVGQFDAAVAIERQAIACLPEDVDLPAFSERLRTYEARAGRGDPP